MWQHQVSFSSLRVTDLSLELQQLHRLYLHCLVYHVGLGRGLSSQGLAVQTWMRGNSGWARRRPGISGASQLARLHEPAGPWLK